MLSSWHWVIVASLQPHGEAGSCCAIVVLNIALDPPYSMVPRKSPEPCVRDSTDLPTG